MIFSIMNVLFAIMCLFIILLVIIQRGKSSMGLGNMGGGNQMLFGSSGGQDIFQKLTWILCIILLAGSLLLATIKNGRTSVYSKAVTSEQDANN